MHRKNSHTSILTTLEPAHPGELEPPIQARLQPPRRAHPGELEINLGSRKRRCSGLPSGTMALELLRLNLDLNLNLL